MASLHNIRALDSLKKLAATGGVSIGASQGGGEGKGTATGRGDRPKAPRAIMDWYVGGGSPS
jgi:hypothetical protein